MAEVTDFLKCLGRSVFIGIATITGSVLTAYVAWYMVAAVYATFGG